MWKEYKPKHQTTITICNRLFKKQGFGGRFHYYDVAKVLDRFLDDSTELLEFKELFLNTNKALFSCVDERGKLIIEKQNLEWLLEECKNKGNRDKGKGI